MPTRAARRPSLFVIVIACWVTACGPTPGEPIAPATSARATLSCGPTDGPAVRILVAGAFVPVGRPVPPYVSVVIARPPGELAGRTWQFGDEGVTSAAHQPATGALEFSTRGVVVVRRVTSDTTIDGTLDVTFPSGVHVRQPFQRLG